MNEPGPTAALASAQPPDVVAPGAGWPYLVLAPVLAALVVGACALRMSTLTADDAFISYRYARNLARGDGPVWNVGHRVEGYTNFLWMLILSGVIRLGGDPVLASKVLGLLATVLLLCEVPRLLRLFPWTYPRSVPLGLGLLVVGPWLPYWAVQGMETPLYAWLVILSIRLFLEDLPQPPNLRMAARAPLALVLLALTRPDGLLVAGILGIVGVASVEPDRRLRFVGLFALPFLLVYAPYFAWRYHYYGYLLPNTFYAKTGARFALVERGARYVAGFARAVGPALLLFMVKPAFGSWWRRPDRAVLAVLLPYAAYVAAVGGDYMPYHRFLTPLYPLLVVLAADGMVAAWVWARSLVRVPLLLALAAYGLLLVNPGLSLGRELSKSDVYDGPMGPDEPDARFALYLGRTAPAGASVATTIIGKIGYYSDLPLHDLLGLTEPAIAHEALGTVGPMAGHDKMDLGFALAQDPTFFYFRPVMAREERPHTPPRRDPIVTPVDAPRRFLDPVLKPFEREFNERYRTVRLDFGDLAVDLYVRRGVAWPPGEDR